MNILYTMLGGSIRKNDSFYRKNQGGKYGER